MAKKSKKSSNKNNMVPLLLLLGLALAALVGIYAVNSVKNVTSNSKAAGLNGVTGNGAPNGAHYNLNIIGVPKSKTADMTGGGSRIFVPLEGKSQIYY